MATGQPSSPEAAPATWRIVRAGLIAAVVAAVVNAVVAALAVAALDISDDLEQLRARPVIALSLLGVIGATVVLLALARWSRRPRARFLAVVGVALPLSLLADVGLLVSDAPGISVSGMLVLMLLHVLAAAVAVTTLLRTLR